MGVVVEIPVEANGAGDCVRVRIATTLDCDNAPAEDSRLWRIVGDVPNEDLPATLETPPRPRGSCVWYIGAAFEDGERVSNWSDAQVIEIPAELGLSDGSIEFDGPGIF